LIDNGLKNYKLNMNSIFYKHLHNYLDIKAKYQYKEILFITICALIILGVILLLINTYLKKMVLKATLVCDEIIKEKLYVSCWIGFAHTDKIGIYTHSKNFGKFIIRDLDTLTIHKTKEKNSSIVRAYLEDKTIITNIENKKHLFHKTDKSFEEKYTHILITPICLQQS